MGGSRVQGAPGPEAQGDGFVRIERLVHGVAVSTPSCRHDEEQRSGVLGPRAGRPWRMKPGPTAANSRLARGGRFRRTKYEQIPDHPTTDRPIPCHLCERDSATTAQTRFATRGTVADLPPVPALDVVPDVTPGRAAARGRPAAPDRRPQAGLQDRQHPDGHLGPGPPPDDRGSA